MKRGKGRGGKGRGWEEKKRRKGGIPVLLCPHFEPCLNWGYALLVNK